jgi:hypothetical protein
MDFIDREGAVSDDLTSVRLAISETRWPLRVKRAAKTRETRGQFRRNQVANSREIRWRKPVKSADGVRRYLWTRAALSVVSRAAQDRDQEQDKHCREQGPAGQLDLGRVGDSWHEARDCDLQGE